MILSLGVFTAMDVTHQIQKKQVCGARLRSVLHSVEGLSRWETRFEEFRRGIPLERKMHVRDQLRKLKALMHLPLSSYIRLTLRDRKLSNSASKF